jgi:hypothetical protein
VPHFILCLIIIFGSLSILGIFFTFPYLKDRDTNEKKANFIDLDITETQNNEFTEKIENQTLKNAIFSKKFLSIWLMTLFTSCK